MHRLLRIFTGTLCVFALSLANASEITTTLPAGSSQSYANTYYDMYITKGKKPCPSTVGANARGHSGNLDAMMEGLAAEMGASGDLDGFAQYFWGVLDTAEKCGDVLGNVPHRIVKAVGDGISKGSQLTRSATKPGGCLSLTSSQKQTYELYLQAQAAKSTWDAIAAACP